MIDPNFDPTAIPIGYRRDVNGRMLTYRHDSGFWYVYTYNEAGRVSTLIDGDGYREAYTYADDGKCTITRTQEASDAA